MDIQTYIDNLEFKAQSDLAWADETEKDLQGYIEDQRAEMRHLRLKAQAAMDEVRELRGEL